MLALIYLISIFVVGFFLSVKLTPWFDGRGAALRQGLQGEGDCQRQVPAWMFYLPVAWLLGALSLNWLNFFASNWSRSISASHSILALALVLSVLVITRVIQRPDAAVAQAWRHLWRGTHWMDGLYLALSLLLAVFISFFSLYDTAEGVQISFGVFSDFSPHTAMIRSFSVGENFPPEYPHFAAGDMPYHFLFHFLAASLEYLGLPLSWAFNLPSIFSLLAFLLLFYVFALRLTATRAVALLAMLFIFFRASWAFFQFAEPYSLLELPQAMSEIDFYAGKTPNAGWGMWTMFNTFANQRHLPFGLGILFAALLWMLPLVEAGLQRESSARPWAVANYSRAIFVGLVLGASAFWNGATLLAALMVLAGFGLMSRNRLEYLIVAVLAVLLSTLQSKAFLAVGKSPVSLTFTFGFLAEQKNLAGVISYIWQAFGVIFPLFFASLFYFRKQARLAWAFLLPTVFAFAVQPTIDAALNHKFVIVSLYLMGVMVAWMLLSIWRNHQYRLAKPLVIVALFLMMVTGVVDSFTFYNINKERFNLVKENPITEWVMANTQPKSIFLTDLVTINQVLYAGRLTYLGYPYYGWSAGYDTKGREEDNQKIYGAGSQADLLKAMEGRKIDYILVNRPVRSATNYIVNEDLIAETYPLVFESDVDETKIYRVSGAQQ